MNFLFMNLMCSINCLLVIFINDALKINILHNVANVCFLQTKNQNLRDKNPGKINNYYFLRKMF